MTVETSTRPSRRAILAAGLGAAVATVASALGRPAPVRAGVDGDVVLGGANTTTLPTIVTNTGGSPGAGR